MSAKALIVVDMRIAVLREQTAQGEGGAETEAQLEELLEERGDLVRQLVAERRGGQTDPAIEKARRAHPP